MGSVTIQREVGVAVLTLDNAPRNVITTEMFHQLGEHVRAFEDDSAIQVVVIHGAGPHLYTVGADIREMDTEAALADREATTRGWLRPIHEVLHAIETSRKVYICAMKGISYGGGLEIAAACDIRVAAPNARFAMPEVKLGIIPGYGGTQRIARLIGMGHALTLVLGAQEIDVPTAREWGLVDMVAPDGEAEETALALARQIAGHAPLALALAKRVIRQGAEMELESGLKLERECFVQCATSADFDEGRRSFLEKRAPAFAGR